MQPVVVEDGNWAILADADQVDDPAPTLFDPDAWRRAGALHGTGTGRGAVSFVEGDFGHAVLRPYLRGGWVAAVSRDRYVYAGLERTRPFHEFRVLAALRDVDLPVPAPLAAGVCRHGRTYAGALLTRAIEGARPLAGCLAAAAPGPGCWRDIGRTIRRFHAAGAWHADLNAGNILLGDEGRVWLIDFDRARYHPGRRVTGRGNLRRLHRSLTKLWPEGRGEALQQAWQALWAGYHE